MNMAILLPGLAATVAGAVAATGHDRVAPRLSARLLVITMAAVVVAVLPAIAVITFGFVTHLPWFDGALAWCRDALGIHPRSPVWLGGAALAWLVVACARLRGVCRSWRKLHTAHSSGVEVLPSSEVFAYTLPGRAGHIVVSDGLLRRLDQQEVDIVLAHERAHASNRHDRYQLAAATAVAVVPVLRPLQRQLRFAVERWADEAAIEELDVDRELVALTVATVALSAAAPPRGAVGIGPGSVTARVTALLEPLPTRRPWLPVLGSAFATLSVLAAAAVQLHHLMPLFVTLCPG
jgi:Zn-dependent protease with chaperone function